MLFFAGIGSVGGILLQQRVRIRSEQLQKETFTFLAIQRRDLLLNSFFDSLNDLRMVGRFFQNSDAVETHEYDSFIGSMLLNEPGIQYSVMDIEKKQLVHGRLEGMMERAALDLLDQDSIIPDILKGTLIDNNENSADATLLLFTVAAKNNSDELYAIIMSMNIRTVMESLIDPEAVLGLPSSLYIYSPVKKLIYYHEPRLDRQTGERLETAEATPYLRYSYQFNAAEMNFELQIDASPAYIQKHNRSFDSLIFPTSLFVGLLLGFIVVWIMNLLVHSRKQLALVEKQFEQFFRLNPDLLAIINEEAVLLHINEAWTDQFSYDIDLLQNRCFFDFMDTRDIPGAKQALSSIIDTHTIISFNGRFKMQTGAFRDMEWHAIHDNAYIYLAGRDISERILYEKELESALKDRETLLREVHHRVKNNLQIVVSMLNLQQNENSDPNLISILTRAQNRIRSMALVHESLYQSDDLSGIDFTAYADTLLSCFMNTDDGKAVQIDLDIEPFYFSLDMTIHFGLLLNELATNSVKHAFKNCPNPGIHIQLKKHSEDRLLFSFEDNGSGLPENFSSSTHSHLGLRLVEALGDQISNEDMHIEYSKGSTGTGTRVLMDLKIDPGSYSRRKTYKTV